MTKPTHPADIVGTSLQLGLLAWETQMVMAMRLMGLAGGWSVLPSESVRMVEEKAPAFAEAALMAARAAHDGKRPDQVVDAWTRSLRRRTTSNTRRLMRRGPRLS